LESAAKRFFKKMMRADHRRLPVTISADKNAAYSEAFTTSQREKILPHDCKLRRIKYLNNIIEQDQRFIKKRVRACLGYRSFDTAERTLQGVEAVNMIRKGQVKKVGGNDAMEQAKFVADLFQLAARIRTIQSLHALYNNLCNRAEKSVGRKALLFLPLSARCDLLLIKQGISGCWPPSQPKSVLRAARTP
jgi:hypothetical protein